MNIAGHFVKSMTNNNISNCTIRNSTISNNSMSDNNTNNRSLKIGKIAVTIILPGMPGAVLTIIVVKTKKFTKFIPR